MAEAQPPVDVGTRHASLRRIMVRNLNARDLHGRDMVEDFENYVQAAASADAEARIEAVLKPAEMHRLCEAAHLRSAYSYEPGERSEAMAEWQSGWVAARAAICSGAGSSGSSQGIRGLS